MANIRPINFYLGLKVMQDRVKKTLKLSQPTYIDKILAKFYLDQAKISNMSMKETLLLSNEGKQTTATERERY